MTVSGTDDASKRPAKEPPSPPGHALWGNLFEFRRNQLDFVTRMSREHGNVIKISSIISNDYIITDPAVAQHILIDNRENYTNQSFEYTGAESLFGRSLFLMEGSDWARRRRMLQSVVQRDRGSGLQGAVKEYAAALLERWNGAARRGELRDIEADLRRLTLLVAGRIFLGADLGSAIDALVRIFDTVNARGDLARNALSLALRFLPTRANRSHRGALLELDRFMYALIKERRAELARVTPSGGAGSDVLTQLILARDENGAALSDTELRDELVTFLFDGSETTSNALAWMWWLLGSHPHAVQTLRDELQRVLGGRTPDAADLLELPYARMCYEEALRLYPPSHLLSRRAKRDDELAGYRIPAGSNLVINIYGLHRRADIWPDPDTFNPERFETRSSTGRHKLAFLPFGAGPRMCIGYKFSLTQAQLITATLAQHFCVRPAAGHVAEPDVFITLRPRSGFLMQVLPV